MFTNSSNVQINGGRFVNTERIINDYSNMPLQPLDILYRHIAPGALLDSSQRFDAPRCSLDTRIAILQTLMDWITERDKGSSIMWLHGPAGAGKSAIAQSIAEQCRNLGLLAAVFFFSRNASTLDRADGRFVIATLVHQLIESFPPLRPYVEKYIGSNNSIFDRGIQAQAENLIVSPTKKLKGSFQFFLARLKLNSLSKHARLFVVDGLDECNDIRVQCEILEVLAKAALDLKLPFRILIASRSELHIRQLFDHGPLLDAKRLDLAHDVNADKDIKTYISFEFKKIIETHPMRQYIPSIWPPQAAMGTLVSRSSGQFIYASTVIKYIQSPKHRPTDRLEVILGVVPKPANDKPYAALDALYTHIFSSADDLDRVKQIFGLLAIPRTTDDGLGVFNTPQMIDLLLSFRPGDTLIILADFISIIALDNDSSLIRHYHASLNDFLLDPARSGILHVNLAEVHERLARRYLTLLQEQSRNASLTHDSDADLYFVAFTQNSRRANLSQELVNDLEKFNLSGLCHFLGHFIISPRKPFSERNDEAMLSTLWRIHNLWASGTMERLFKIFNRPDLPNHVIVAQIYALTQSSPLVKEKKPFDSLVASAYTFFKKSMFCACTMSNDEPCQACSDIPPSALMLSYQLLYAQILHCSLYIRPQYCEDLTSFQEGRTCAYLQFLDHIVGRAAEYEKETAKLYPYADFFFDAVLDCAEFVMPFSSHDNYPDFITTKKNLYYALDKNSDRIGRFLTLFGRLHKIEKQAQQMSQADKIAQNRLKTLHCLDPNFR